MNSKTIKKVNEIPTPYSSLMKNIHHYIMEIHGKSMNDKLNECLKKGYPAMFFEAKEYNIYDEYSAIKKLMEARGGSTTPYEEGRLKVLEYMINSIIADPIEGDYYEKTNNDLIKEAGRLLSQD